jgi:DNA-binding LacI/PurR family transcriptional regulator
VSYVLNDTPHQKIPDETRRRVLDAAARLGYAPSAAARALRSGRSDVVLCLLPDWPMGPEVGAMLGNLSTALAVQGMTFVAHPTARADRPVSDIWKSITPAAVLAFEELSDPEIAAMHAAGVAVVVALLGRSRQRRRELEVPQQRVGRLQVEHLASVGHTRLGYAYPDDERLQIFAQPRLVAVQLWRGARPAVSAVCAYNDEVALAVLAGLRLLGLDAPGDLAVIGVDDIPVARLAAPPLTTVTTDQAAVAQHLAATIIAVIAGRPEPSRLDPDIVQVTRRASA